MASIFKMRLADESNDRHRLHDVIIQRARLGEGRADYWTCLTSKTGQACELQDMGWAHSLGIEDIQALDKLGKNSNLETR